MPATLTRQRSLSDSIPRRMRHTVRDFYRMEKAGVFAPERRYELLEGDIFQVPKPTPLHASRHDWLTRALITRLGARYWLRTQNPVRLDNFSEPLPDFAVLKPRKEAYSTHPRPGDTLLIIELAQSSLSYDIGRKQRAYAKAGIPEYWVLDLTDRQLHVFRKPAAIGYAQAQVLDTSDEIESTTVKGLRFTVREMVG